MPAVRHKVEGSAQGGGGISHQHAVDIQDQIRLELAELRPGCKERVKQPSCLPCGRQKSASQCCVVQQASSQMLELSCLA